MNQLINFKDIPEYYQRYTSLVSDGDYIELMQQNLDEIKETFNLLHQKADYAYASGKWTVIQVLSHLIDVERVMVNRMHVFSRNEKEPIPGFNHDEYVNQADLSNKTIEGLLTEFEMVRAGTMHMVNSFSSDELKRNGEANNLKFTTEGLSWIILGHTIHHLNILKERYVD
jgi:light-regulated signal transduction histidine kinase (bacteriophytochrome)